MTLPLSPAHVDLPKEQRAVVRASILVFAVCPPILVLASLGLPRFFDFPNALAERLAFALRAALVIVLWGHVGGPDGLKGAVRIRRGQRRLGAHAAGALPPITYTSGGLEDARIRKSVCDILEGGEDAFKERARRLRVRLQR